MKTIKGTRKGQLSMETLILILPRKSTLSELRF